MEAVAAIWTIESEEDGSSKHPAACPASLHDLMRSAVRAARPRERP